MKLLLRENSTQLMLSKSEAKIDKNLSILVLEWTLK